MSKTDEERRGHDLSDRALDLGLCALHEKGLVQVSLDDFERLLDAYEVQQQAERDMLDAIGLGEDGE